MEALLAFTVLLIGYSLVSARVLHGPLTPPLVFALGGLALSPEGLGLIEIPVEGEPVRLLAEATLVLILFTDAARIDLSAVEHNPGLPLRLLGIGLPLTVAAGTLVGVVLLLDLEFWEAAILAVVLAPTDAALGQAVVSDARVPARVRQALNVESGLNDGLSVPFLFVFIAFAAVAENAGATGFWTRFAAEQIGYGAAIGVGIGGLSGWAVRTAVARGLMDRIAQGVAVIAVPLACFALAEIVGGNAFIAAFVAGLSVGRICGGDVRERLLVFSEREGLLLTTGTFFVFGAAMAAPALADLSWRIVLYALLSLTLVRMVPVAIALVGTGLHRGTFAFLGWFGPRGIASIVLGLIVLEEPEIAGAATVFDVMAVTVLVSVVLHGVTAPPWAARYGRTSSTMDEDAPEMHEVMPIPPRAGHGRRNRGD